jgi:hypothetical protein
MELSILDVAVVLNRSKKLETANALANTLDLSNDIDFSTKLKSARDQFPLTFKKCSAWGWKKISKLNPSQKDELKNLIESEMEPLIEEARVNNRQAKTIHGEALPTDLSACFPRLAEIKATKKRKIMELQKEIEQVDDASDMLDLMQKNQGILQNLDTLTQKRGV